MEEGQKWLEEGQKWLEEDGDEMTAMPLALSSSSIPFQLFHSRTALVEETH